MNCWEEKEVYVITYYLADKNKEGVKINWSDNHGECFADTYEEALKMKEKLLNGEEWQGGLVETCYISDEPEIREFWKSEMENNKVDVASGDKEENIMEKTNTEEFIFIQDNTIEKLLLLKREQERNLNCAVTPGIAEIFKKNIEALEQALNVVSLMREKNKKLQELSDAKHTYKKLENVFPRIADVLRNSNGRDYKVLDILPKNDVLLCRMSDNEICVAHNLKMYEREFVNADDEVLKSEIEIEWGHADYYGSSFSNIDFGKLYDSYREKEMDTDDLDYSSEISRSR